MTEIDRQIIVLFRQLSSDKKIEFIDLVKGMCSEVDQERTSAQPVASSEDC